MTGSIRVERENALGWIVFDHLEKRNAISESMWQMIPEALKELDMDDDVRVILLRGAGTVAFASGADISEFEESRIGAATKCYEGATAAAYSALQEVRKPLVAMIHGFCVGGGMAAALLADLRYASEDSLFSIPAARLGLGYPLEGVKTLVGLAGPSIAKEVFFTARTYDSEEALRFGFVNNVFPKADLEEQVIDIAARIASNAPLTLESIKLAARELQRPVLERDHEALTRSVQRCFESADYREGVRAFLEKRRPEFQGR